MKALLHVLPETRTASDPSTGAMLFRRQSAQLIAELGHVHGIIVRSDCQIVGDVLESRDPEKYHAYLIAAVRELG